MYSPIRDDMERSVRSVRYSEVQPPSSLAGLVLDGRNKASIHEVKGLPV